LNSKHSSEELGCCSPETPPPLPAYRGGASKLSETMLSLNFLGAHCSGNVGSVAFILIKINGFGAATRSSAVESLGLFSHNQAMLLSFAFASLERGLSEAKPSSAATG